MQRLFLFYLLAAFIPSLFAGSPQQWKSRTIYQLLTDRFARTDGSTDPCDDFHNYCGGTWAGIMNKLDYIQGMGFDAIWISPIPTNYPGGFHGYWQTNLYEVNPYFGTSSDLIDLVQECHNRGIWVMLDVVGNHVGPVGYDYSSIVPFNQSDYYHNCNPCPFGCSIQDWTNQPQVEWCRLAGLPDLDQTNPFVQQALLEWIRDTVSNFSFDGLRVDTTPEVPKTFWQQYVPTNTYAVGEVFNGDVNYVASYQQAALPGVLSYPLFFNLRNVFANKQSMYNLQSINQAYSSAFPDVNLLGTFLDNHDNARFLSQESDIQIYKNALLYTLYSQGIPIIYYGSEQEFNGGNDPYNREPLWTSSYNTEAPLYEFLSTIIQFRKQAQIWNYPQIQRYADDSFYAFSRGQVFVAMTNGGSQQSGLQRTITYHPYSNGQKICNLFYPTTDCIVIQNNQFNVYLENGECKVYRPA